MVVRILKGAAVAAVAGVALAAIAVSADAGQYHVYSCRTPAGESAPADGWSGSVAAGGAYDDHATNTCASGGALIAALGDQTIHIAGIDMATWAFEAPVGATIAGAILWRAGDTVGGPATQPHTSSGWRGPPKQNIFDECIYTQGCPGKGNLGQPFVG